MTSLFGKVKEFSRVDPGVPAETPGKTGTSSPHSAPADARGNLLFCRQVCAGRDVFSIYLPLCRCAALCPCTVPTEGS